MTDLKKPRLAAKNENGGCTILGADQIDIECGSVKNAILISNCLYRLFELENAIESGELVPVVHGRWLQEYGCRFGAYGCEYNPYLVCSRCGAEVQGVELEDKETVPEYCHCGAKMDLEEEK